eukprot:14058792-Alexandrium_andersonii.AAC.1
MLPGCVEYVCMSFTCFGALCANVRVQCMEWPWRGMCNHFLHSGSTERCRAILSFSECLATTVLGTLQAR